MSKLSKFLRSDGGKIATSLALGYTSKQSSDFRKVAPVASPVIESLVTAPKAEKHDVLKNTVYAVAATGLLNAANKQIGVVQMPEQHITPVKTGTATSTFKAATLAALLTPLLPILYKMAETWVGTLPENSWLAFVMPGLLAAFYGLVRYLTTNGARHAEAEIATAQAATAIVSAQAGNAEPQPVTENDMFAPSDVTLNPDEAAKLQELAVLEAESASN